MIDKAKQKVKVENVKFSMMDISQKWVFDDHDFDLIICNLILEHIEDLSFVFSESARVLQSPGRFFLNELHPFKQYEGKKARFDKGDEIIEVDAFLHHVSEYVKAAVASGLKLIKLEEYWHEEDQNKPPRILSFLFGK